MFVLVRVTYSMWPQYFGLFYFTNVKIGDHKIHTLCIWPCIYRNCVDLCVLEKAYDSLVYGAISKTFLLCNLLALHC